MGVMSGAARHRGRGQRGRGGGRAGGDAGLGGVGRREQRLEGVTKRIGLLTFLQMVTGRTTIK